MSLTKVFTPAVLVALALSVTPAYAQHRGGGGHTGGTRGGTSTSRGTAVPRSTVPSGAAVPRVGVRNYPGRFYGGPSFGYALGAPYYAFRPRVGLGLGLWLGYPIAYPYWAFSAPYVYGYPYPVYGYPYPDGYAYPYGDASPGGYPAPDPAAPDNGTARPPADQNAVTATPGTGAQTQYGGLSFQITPPNASVFVDSVYVGVVSQFSPTTQPLTLAPGRHHIEIRAENYRSLSFDVNVAPGQVLPYQGTMQQQ
jgi:PEGA domain